ncbi:MAG: sulfate adenylyltransferase subunit CysD [Pseudomonadota bacterium]
MSSYLDALESEAIHIIRDGVTEAENPVLLFSAGKDSTVLAHLAVRAFYPSKPPMPLLHVDSTWEFRDLLTFRDDFAEKHGFELRVHANETGREMGLNPIDHADTYTTVMRTDALKQALDDGKYDVIFGGARRDEEASRAKERVVSVRSADHSWEPKSQRPELWNSYNWRRTPGSSLRAFPLSNWTEADLWAYIIAKEIELAPLYYAAPRKVIDYDGTMIVMDEPERLKSLSHLKAETKMVRFRTLGCWPVTGAVESGADTALGIAQETTIAGTSERQGRVSDAGSLENQKRAGYF